MKKVELPQKFKVLNGITLKWIALLSMVIDHFNGVVLRGLLSPYLKDGALVFSEDLPKWIFYYPMINEICNALGRIAFPLFCFLISEGFIHTKNRRRYGFLILLFALITEIPFNIAHYREFFNFALQNVMFTLCVGVFTLIAFSDGIKKFGENKPYSTLFSIAVILVGMAVSTVLRSEYAFLGIASIMVFYILKDAGDFRVFGILPLVAVLPWAILSAPFILLYNGKRGHGNKYFFYIFYPAHFLVLAFLRYILLKI